MLVVQAGQATAQSTAGRSGAHGPLRYSAPGPVCAAHEPPMTQPSTAFAGLLPGDVVVMQTLELARWNHTLWPTEREYVRHAVASRQAEFASGRACMRAAMATLGCPAVAIGVGPHREPLLPAGLAASITHTADYCAAAAVRTGRIRSLGIDTEMNRRLGDEVARLVLHTHEIDAAQAAGRAGMAFDAMLFSLKESLFKALFPFAREILEFTDASIAFDPQHDACTIRPGSPVLQHLPASMRLVARYRFCGTRVHTAVTVLNAQD